METQPENQIFEAQIRIVGIKTREFHLADITDLTWSGVDFKNGVRIKLGALHKISAEQNLFEFIFTVSYVHQLEGSEESERLLMKFSNSAFFEIMNFSDVIQVKSQDDYFVEPGFLGIILSIVFSTTRGILCEKLANTSLSEFMLPIINPQDVVSHIFGK